jgi:hypothetical protein
MLRIPHCLDSRFTNDVRLSALRTGRALPPRNIFLLELSTFRLVAQSLNDYDTACPLYSGYCWFLSPGVKRPERKAHHFLIPRLRMRGAVLPRPHPSCLVRRRDAFSVYWCAVQEMFLMLSWNCCVLAGKSHGQAVYHLLLVWSGNHKVYYLSACRARETLPVANAAAEVGNRFQ